ncbi:MAG: hypothetical protein HOO96_18820 [Polyangiaceae bacterium]|nr:hypothetical protein [Polyangiaceae bacterium]
MKLVVCPTCSRHAKGSVCPFCRAALPTATPDVAFPAGLARAALVSSAAVVLAGAMVIACAEAQRPPEPPPVALYGAAPAPEPTASAPAVTGSTASTAPEPVRAVALYGAAPLPSK